MRKNNNIIEINGQRYDAKTGAVLSQASPGQASAKPTPAAHHPQAAAPRPAAPAVAKRASKHSPHRPAAARTLMRQAVKKPGPSLKRQVKAQGQIDALAERPLARLATKKSIGQLDAERLRHAKQIHQSRLISHFPAFTAGDVIKVRTALAPTEAINQASIPAKQPPTHARRPKTTAELLDQAVQQATSHLEPPPKPARRRLRHSVAR
jgi:hypothetical protein